MQETTNEVFINLFKEAFEKCFGTHLHNTLSETECRHFSNEIFDKTGLVIGAKSLKNYSSYVVNLKEAKPEKPSAATLDTLARYVLNAPYTDETRRKEKESHFPYWFQYRNHLAAKKRSEPEVREATTEKTMIAAKSYRKTFLFTGIIVVVILLSAIYFFTMKKNRSFTDDFHNVDTDSLQANGWFLQSEDKQWWNKRNEMPAHLTLYTLTGDNWADSAHEPNIRNLLLRKIPSDCFTTEVQLDSFVPMHRWQQAGILMLEDSNFKGKSLRLSFAYNDFFGGYNRPKEIIVQGITSSGKDANNPEEIIHLPVFSIGAGQDSLVTNNLKKSALRIEKNGTYYRFLYATGQANNFAFKEVLAKDIFFQPKYVGIFALEGFVNEKNFLPARFKHFSFADKICTH